MHGPAVIEPFPFIVRIRQESEVEDDCMLSYYRETEARSQLEPDWGYAADDKD